jgi:hypothetical protein
MGDFELLKLAQAPSSTPTRRIVAKPFEPVAEMRWPFTRIALA